MKWAALGALLLAGCAAGETVYLKTADGKSAQCGPYQTPIIAGSAGSIAGGATRQAGSALRNCVEDFQKAGYQRVSAP